MTLSDRIVITFAKYVQRPTLALVWSQPLLRRLFRITATLNHARPLPGLRQTHLGDRRTLVGPGKGALMWIHGGGFTIGAPETHAPMVTRLAERTGLAAHLPSYRLAPEHPFPAAADDILAAYRALVAQSDGAIVVGGDSAGGALALSLLLDCATHGVRPPDCFVLASPVVDLDPSTRTHPGASELLIPEAWMRRSVPSYIGTSDPTQPRMSPVNGTFAAPPPVMFQTGIGEMLEIDTDRMAETLRAAGGNVTVDKVAHMPHVWQLYAGRCTEADLALDRMAAFIAQHTV